MKEKEHQCKPHETIKWLMVSLLMRCGCSQIQQHDNRLDCASWKRGESSPFIGDERWNGRLRSNARWRARIPQDQWGGGQVSSTWIRVFDHSKGAKGSHMCEQPLMVTCAWQVEKVWEAWLLTHVWVNLTLMWRGQARKRHARHKEWWEVWTCLTHVWGFLTHVWAYT